MKKLMKKRTGFTLVELLIVIIIIGILAGAMLLVAGSGTDKAEATKIVSNLRSMKAATLLYYADHPSETDFPTVASLDEYMDRKISTIAGYTTIGSGDTEWYVGKNDLTSNSGINDKLDDNAVETGLLGTDRTAVFTKADKEVWMRAR